MEGHSTAGSTQDGNSGFHSVFHGGYNEVLFFSGLQVSSAQQLLAACVVVFLLGLVNEGLRLLMAWLKAQLNASPPPLPSLQPLRSMEQKLWLRGAVHTFTYIFHLFVHYCLMLVFMTLNVWLCLSMLLGAGLGYLLFHFRPVKSRVFRFFGMREPACAREEKEGEEKETYSEMTDMNVSPDNSEEFKWNSSPKK